MNKIETFYIFYGILLGVLLLQCTLGMPIDDDMIKKLNRTYRESNEKIHLSGRNFTEYYANRTANTTRRILKDPNVIANHNMEVEEFKLNLTTLLNNYDAIQKDTDANGEIRNSTAKEKAYLNVMEHFMNITEYYFEMPEAKVTSDSKFIADNLKKHGGYEIYFELKTFGDALGHIIARVLAEILFGWMKSNRH